MPVRPVLLASRALLIVTCLVSLTGRVAASDLRKSPIVTAVAKARPSVVNIHSEKTLTASDTRFGQVETSRRVNGMGTGVVVDERGYIITNQHVIDGVEKIQVTLHDGTIFTARLISEDKKTDLAVIKINSPEKLPVITIGTSKDLMTGESVIAVGNAYGYEHTVTRGIISALNRSVQLNDTQKYANLIQTDASINPGNSGGPLLNIDGEMIGINVAVRAGAQGIGFAIPVDKALEVAADLLSTRRVDHLWHGIILAPVDLSGSGLMVGQLIAQSPASKSGLKPGDLLTAVDGKPMTRALDLERAMLGRKSGDQVELTVQRDDEKQAIQLQLAGLTAGLAADPAIGADQAWDVFGLKLDPVAAKQFSQFKSRYRGGMWITEVRADGPAAKQGIRPGDILVGLHIWETISAENLAHILGRSDIDKLDPLKFYVLRGGKTLYGFLPLEQ